MTSFERIHSLRFLNGRYTIIGTLSKEQDLKNTYIDMELDEKADKLNEIILDTV